MTVQAGYIYSGTILSTRNKEMIQMTNKWLVWSPRILAILMILFLLMLSLDVFDGSTSPAETALGFLIHNVPTLILMIVLAIAWNHELVGAIAFYTSGLVYVVFAASRAPSWLIGLSFSLVIAGPAFLIATLFLIGWLRKRNLNI